MYYGYLETFFESFPQLVLQSTFFIKEMKINNFVISYAQVLQIIKIAISFMSICFLSTLFVKAMNEIVHPEHIFNNEKYYLILRLLSNILFLISKIIPLVLLMDKLNDWISILTLVLVNSIIMVLKAVYYYKINIKYFKDNNNFKVRLTASISSLFYSLIKSFGFFDRFEYSFTYFFTSFSNFIENISYFIIYWYLDSFNLTYFNVICFNIVYTSLWISFLIETIKWELFSSNMNASFLFFFKSSQSADLENIKIE